MRFYIVDSVRTLADPDYQHRAWIRGELPSGHYDDLDLHIHVLFDDTGVLPEPEPSIGDVIYSDEVDVLRDLTAALDPLIDELGDVGDAEYLAHPRWADVVSTAGAAFRVLHANDSAC